MSGMGWDLPPGVTGREDAFGPQAETSEERECDQERNFRVYSDEVTELLEMLAFHANENPKALPVEVSLLFGLVRDADLSGVVEDVECPFKGTVDVQYWNHRVTWTCPLCGYDHEEDLPEPDFDEDRDD